MPLGKRIRHIPSVSIGRRRGEKIKEEQKGNEKDGKDLNPLVFWKTNPLTADHSLSNHIALIALATVGSLNPFPQYTNPS
jgi:hypothetical protein